jgi:4-hydroxy-tetrahydrodipicolinate synthase
MTAQTTPHSVRQHQGVWPALLTPFDASLNVNIPAMAAHAQRLLARDCAGVTLFGTTGEGPSLTVVERMHALEDLVDGGVPAQRIIVHTTCAAIPDSIVLTRHATDLGVHACLLAPPFFFKGVSDQGVERAYTQVIDAVQASVTKPMAIVLYHIPQIMGVALSVPLVQTLAKRYPSVILGVKDSGGDVNNSKALISALPHLQIWVGNEPDLQTMAALGSSGAISGVANVMPELVSQLIADGFDVAKQAQVVAFLKVLFQYPLMPAFKVLMAQHTGDDGWLRVRAPLVALDAEQSKSFLSALPVGLSRN